MVPFLIDLWMFLRVRRKFWLLPIILVLIIVGGLAFVGQGSALAPFLYVLF
jgi:hypothetical protein